MAFADKDTFKMCPQFIEFNRKCIVDLSNRYSKHNSQRSRHIKLCADETLGELCKLPSFFMIKAPIFTEKENILHSSIREMNYLIHKTPTVQAAKCKKIIATYPQFTKKANNKQDQNSWKVSGQHFFSPYIDSFIHFINNDYLSQIQINNKYNNNINKEKICQLSGIIFAIKILEKKVKFERAKEKPLIRDRTLVNSSYLHNSFRKLHYQLNVPKFYLIEKAKRKKIKKKIQSQKFHHDICQFAKYLLDNETKSKKDIINYHNYDFPNDWIDNNDNINNNINIIINNNNNTPNTDTDTDNESDIESVHESYHDNDQKQNININHHRLFQSTANFNNLSNGINKGLLSMNRNRNMNRNMNRKINQEIHINEMRNIAPFAPFTPFVPFTAAHANTFDIAPTTMTRVGSETIMDSDMHTNDMGYSFN